MLFHKSGIKHIIAELKLLDFLDKEYPEKPEQVKPYVEKLKDYAEGRGKDSLETIYKHAENVLKHIEQDKERHFVEFVENIVKLRDHPEIGDMSTTITALKVTFSDIKSSCIQLELNLRELLSKIKELHKSFVGEKPLGKDHVEVITRYRNNALESGLRIEARSLQAVTAIKKVHKSLVEMRQIIREVEEKANKSHWVYANIMSWL